MKLERRKLKIPQAEVARRMATRRPSCRASSQERWTRSTRTEDRDAAAIGVQIEQRLVSPASLWRKSE